MSNAVNDAETLKLPADKVVPDPTQPRKTFIAVQEDELVQSFQMNGQLLPIIVYKCGDQWIIVDGERRWRSAMALNWEMIEARVLPVKPSESQILIIQLTANCQRSDLHPLDRLEAFKQLIRMCNWKASDLATNLAISKPTVSRILSLDRFSEDEKSLLRNGAISTTEAYALARLNDDERSTRLKSQRLSVCDKASADTSQAVSPTSSLSLAINGNTIRFRGKACESFDAMLDALKLLARECRRAKREGIDPKTFARVLEDKSQPKKENDHVSNIS